MSLMSPDPVLPEVGISPSFQVEELINPPSSISLVSLSVLPARLEIPGGQGWYPQILTKCLLNE